MLTPLACMHVLQLIYPPEQDVVCRLWLFSYKGKPPPVNPTFNSTMMTNLWDDVGLTWQPREQSTLSQPWYAALPLPVILALS